MRDVGVLPAQVENPAVIHHRGAEVMILLETQLTHVAAVGVHQVSHPDVDRGIARHTLERCRRDKSDVVVRQVARIEIVHVDLSARGQAPQMSAVYVDFINLPELTLVRH